MEPDGRDEVTGLECDVVTSGAMELDGNLWNNFDKLTVQEFMWNPIWVFKYVCD